MKDYSKFSRDYLYQQYVVNKRSVGDIAKEHGTYANKIRRQLLKYGFTLRDKSEAQAEALAQNRSTHPTKGKKRSEETKAKIGESVAESWKAISQEEYSRRSEFAKEQWGAMTPEQKESMSREATKALSETARNGSKVEQYLADGFRKLGIAVEPHKNDFFSHTQLTVDLYLPQSNIVIEVDGPSHFQNIWGEDYLAEKQRMDNEKNGLLIGMGIVVIRLRIHRNHISKYFLSKTLKTVVETVKKIHPSELSIEERVIYLDIKD